MQKVISGARSVNEGKTDKLVLSDLSPERILKPHSVKDSRDKAGVVLVSHTHKSFMLYIVYLAFAAVIFLVRPLSVVPSAVLALLIINFTNSDGSLHGSSWWLGWFIALVEVLPIVGVAWIVSDLLRRALNRR